jgi:hypothetical protein
MTRFQPGFQAILMDKCHTARAFARTKQRPAARTRETRAMSATVNDKTREFATSVPGFRRYFTNPAFIVVAVVVTKMSAIFYRARLYFMVTACVGLFCFRHVSHCLCALKRIQSLERSFWRGLFKPFSPASEPQPLLLRCDQLGIPLTIV